MDITAILASQLEASLLTLQNAMEGCPKDQWQEAHGDAPFSQVVFHTLFYCDFYLSESESAFRDQRFHQEHKAFFDDYEELEYKLPVHVYERPALETYLAFCKEKVKLVLGGMDLAKLSEPALMRKSIFSKLELMIYLARHIQHHAAQLGLRVQTLTGQELKWVSMG